MTTRRTFERRSTLTAGLVGLLLCACPDSVTNFPKDSGTPTCSVGTQACGGACVNTTVDDANCGGCGIKCKATEHCGGASCIPKDCTGFECAAGQVCFNAKACQFSVCVGVDCGANLRCNDQGKCVSKTCGGTTCLDTQSCVNNVCKDIRCDGVTCHNGDVCVGGGCFPTTCAQTPCGAGQVCDGDTCVVKSCVETKCSSGETCVEGECKPESCNGTACKSGQTCENNVCTDVVCQSITCGSGQACHQGRCVTETSSCDGGVSDDVNNCGACGTVCATPVHSTAACYSGTCGRGPCAAGFFDIDGPATPGCESTCVGTTCTLPDGGTVVTSVPPDSQAGGSAGVLNSGANVGASAQTNGEYRHVGMMGESPAGGQPKATNSTHAHTGGFTGISK